MTITTTYTDEVRMGKLYRVGQKKRKRPTWPYSTLASSTKLDITQ